MSIFLAAQNGRTDIFLLLLDNNLNDNKNGKLVRCKKTYNIKRKTVQSVPCSSKW